MQSSQSVTRSLRRLTCCRCHARLLTQAASWTRPTISISSDSSLPSTSTSTYTHANTKRPQGSSSKHLVSRTRVNTKRYINTIAPEEVSHFSSLSQTWWNEKGDFNVLQRMNKVRVEFLRERLKMVMRNEPDVTLAKLKELEGPFPLRGKRVLDVGCGGGLFTERLARLGAEALAIDASEENVKTAIMHASQDPKLAASLASGQLEYRHSAIENLVQSAESVKPDSKVKEQFDVVFAMEVLEHVADPQGFLRCLSQAVKPGGHLILSTISRTPLARLVTITLAESPLLRLAPAGSHTYEKFIRPDEVIDFFTQELGWSGPTSPSILHSAPHSQGTAATDNHLSSERKSLRYEMEVRGTTYLPWQGEWTLFPADDSKGVISSLAKSCNYFFGARKPL